MSLRYDPEWIAATGPSLEVYKKEIPVHDVKTRRDLIGKLYEKFTLSVPEDLDLSTLYASAPDGHEVTVYRVFKKEVPVSTTPAPAVVHIHGGGYTAVSAAQALPSIVQYVSQSGVQFFTVDYRLAPENPYPIPAEDCYAALKYVQSNAATFNIDPTRIAIMGESAGGGLAAGVAILARERQLSPPLKKQILLYPMLDDRTNKDTVHGLSVFSLSDIITGWSAYLGKAYGTEDVVAAAAAARVTDVKRLPPLYLDVGQLDHFVHENLAYASRFIAADIETELHIYPGVIHAFQRWSLQSHVVRQATVNRMRAIRTI
ncbi:hypothetical protein RBB50_012499 [Rhinocladiella similis]